MTDQTRTGCPYAGSRPQAFSADTMTYGDYLRIPDLIELQTLRSESQHHDELLFIIIHQAYELWFKLILHEMENSISYMQKLEVLRAHHFMKRIGEIFRLLVQQIHILETMTPIEFLEFRDALTPASGFQSVQFREIEFLAGLKDERHIASFKNRPSELAQLSRRWEQPDLLMSFYEMLRRLGFKIPERAAELEREGDPGIREELVRGLLPIYKTSSDHLPVYLLSESLVEFDQYLGLWREHHVRVVERLIGAKKGTGGSQGVEYLRSTTLQKCFPSLWEVRSHLTCS